MNILPSVCPGVGRTFSLCLPNLIISSGSSRISAWALLFLDIIDLQPGSNDFNLPLPVMWSAWTCVFTVNVWKICFELFQDTRDYEIDFKMYYFQKFIFENSFENLFSKIYFVKFFVENSFGKFFFGNFFKYLSFKIHFQIFLLKNTFSRISFEKFFSKNSSRINLVRVVAKNSFF